MTARNGLLAASLVVMLHGCATTTQKYDWGKYDASLYAYYKDPTKSGELSASLAAVIDSANSHRARVPPGIYAEYGYLQLEAGQNQLAVASFRQEAAHWPESKFFMDQMIKAASTPASVQPAKSPSQ
jgi:hypothetical protein